ncbi:hypothetical protein J7L67_02050 [bacterium]|nr:hypothetical protein [bacterium]
MKKLLLLILFGYIAVNISSCSVIMAVQKPEKKDVTIFQEGMPRNMILAEFGPPVSSDINKNGNKEEMWTFDKGESKWWKGLRAVFHTAADVFTLFLWEVVAIPTELALEKNSSTYVVEFDNDNKATKIQCLRK